MRRLRDKALADDTINENERMFLAGLLVGELEKTWPDAAASLHEGMADTLTLMRLGSPGSSPRRCARPTPASRWSRSSAHTQRNVKRWQNGDGPKDLAGPGRTAARVRPEHYAALLRRYSNWTFYARSPAGGSNP